MVGPQDATATNALSRLILAAVALSGLLVALTPAASYSLRPSQVPAATDRVRVPERARSARAFIDSIGVNTHLNYFDRTYGNFARVKAELGSIGIRHVRDGIHFQDKAYNELVYGRWAELGAAGIRFDAVLDPRSNLGPLTPELLEQAERLSNSSIEAFECPNELDISGIQDWSTLDRNYTMSLFKTVKELPQEDRVEVVGPSLASAKHGTELGNLANYVDAGNLHPYPAGRMPSQVFPEQPELARIVSGPKRIFITESGYHNALNDHTDQPAVSEAAAAKYIPRLLLENFSMGVARTYLYELFDEAPDPALSDNQLHWGLVRADGSEKPAFLAVKRLIDILASNDEPAHVDTLAWSIDSTSPEIHHLLLEKANGEFDLVFWLEASSYDVQRQSEIMVAPVATTLSLDRRVHRAVLYRPSEAAGPAKTFANTKTIPLLIPDHPIVLRLSYR